jgi:tRNA/rRNA methyltransferase
LSSDVDVAPQVSGARIVLVHPLFPGNVGAAARAMANTGVDELVLVDPPAFDMERARWMATGGVPLLERARFVGDVAEAVEGCVLAVGTSARPRRWGWPVWSPEDSGLDNESLGRCQAILKIPTAAEPSLNLSQAVLIVCSAIFEEGRRRGLQQTTERPQTPKPKAPSDRAPIDLQRKLIEATMEALAETIYLDGRNPDQVFTTLSILLERAQPTRAELDVLRGMVAKTSWSLKNGPRQR